VLRRPWPAAAPPIGLQRPVHQRHQRIARARSSGRRRQRSSRPPLPAPGGVRRSPSANAAAI
jgi:hypothetical protein